jgi:hypothetical protein
MISILDSYRGQSVALPTLHHKGALIAPAFLSTLGMTVVEVNVNTDLLGSFAGETQRVGTQLETARKKALLGIEASGLSFALASEGSIGADPQIGLITSDIETIVFIDTVNNLEIVEHYKSFDIVAHQITFETGMDLEAFLVQSDFPYHQLIVRSEYGYNQVVGKGIKTKEELNAAIEKAQALKIDPIIIESDLRAHCSPSRAENIKRTAERLALKIATLCPQCQTPGWSAVQPLFGLSCSECGQESDSAVRAHLYGCLRCAHTVEGQPIADSIDPSRCNWCNP